DINKYNNAIDDIANNETDDIDQSDSDQYDNNQHDNDQDDTDNKNFTIKLVNNEFKLKEKYDENIDKIRTNKFYDKFSNENFCNDFFSKFVFIDGLNINKLKSEIYEIIEKIYSDFNLLIFNPSIN